MTKPISPEEAVAESSHLTKHQFDQFNLQPELLKGLDKAGFHYCTKIQAKALPLALAGENIAGQAQTGTGKTAAFLLAIFQKLLTKPSGESRSKSVRAVVLAPTRELAIQIHRDAQTLSTFTDLRLGLVYGGTGYQQQRDMLIGGVDLLIGTPGRLIDYFKQGLFELKSVEVVVLDEADRMLDLGFIRDIRYILRRMPAPDKRLNMLFSATLSYRITELAYEYMHDPQTLTIASNTPVDDGLVERVYYPANDEKLPLLLGVIKQIRGDRILVFANTRSACDQLGRVLSKHRYSTGILSGEIPQKKREHLLELFKKGEKQILVATDVAARGLHIPKVSHVFNYDLPQDPEDYVLRIGRTARAGESGYAISFACEEHALSLLDIEQFVGHKLTRKEISDHLLISPRRSLSGERGKPITENIEKKGQQKPIKPAQNSSRNQKTKHQQQSSNSKNQYQKTKKASATQNRPKKNLSKSSITDKPHHDHNVPAIG